MDFYVIVPRYYTHLVKDETHFLVIAQHLMEWGEYYEFFKTLKAEHPDVKIILDNGIIEYGEPVDNDILLEIADDFDVTEVVAPDTWKNGRRTFGKALNFSYTMEKWAEDREMTSRRPFQIMGVPHGYTLDEYVYCATDLVTRAAVNSLGLAYREWQDGTGVVRTFMSHYMRDHEADLHLLGLWNTNELTKCHPKVRSVDTSLPFRAAKEGTAIYSGYANTKRFDFEMKLTEMQEQRAKVNIEYLKYLCAAPKENIFTEEWRKQYGN